MNTIRCILDGCFGIHIPKSFVVSCDHEELIKSGASVDDIAIVRSGPDHEHFWEAWDNILRDVSWEEDGHTWTLHQDGDLFEVRDDHEWE